MYTTQRWMAFVLSVQLHMYVPGMSGLLMSWQHSALLSIGLFPAAPCGLSGAGSNEYVRFLSRALISWPPTLCGKAQAAGSLVTVHEGGMVHDA